MKKNYSLFAFVLITGFTISLFGQAPQIIPGNFTGLSGLWEFENSGDLLHATTGTDLTLTGSHTQVTGPTVDDNAINIGSGSYYTCTHNIPANGGGSDVNEYSLVFDFKISDISEWHSFYQANAGNSNDGEIFINSSGQIGRTTDGPGYTTYTVSENEWYRMVISVDLDNFYRIYLDGALVLDGGALSIDGEYGIYSASADNLVHFFADDNGEDNEIEIAVAAIFDHSLTQTEIDDLSGYGHEIIPILTGVLPYLQTPTPTSIYVSWHSNQTSSTNVEYGTNISLGSTTTGSVQDINGKQWHTVQLTGLLPDTEYFYKCVSETEESEINVFKTPNDNPEEEQFLRFILLGDSRTDIAKTAEIVNNAKAKAIEMYGEDIQNQINMVINVGDIVSSGSVISQYEDEYFKPYACLSNTLPFMVIIGNHEAESSNFYDYMKYEDLSAFGWPIEERFYDMYYFNTHFVFINGNTALQNGIQTSWVESALDESAANNDVDMVFCFTHQPGHSELWPDGNTEYIQEDIIPVLRNYDKVQMLAYGHSHNYERGTIESLAENSLNDFYIMLTGGAGSALDRWGMYPNQQDYEEVMIALDNYLFNIVDIDLVNKTFENYTYSLGNSDKPRDCELVDYFYLKLDQQAPSTPMCQSPVLESGLLPLLVASEFEGVDSLMSAKFQITETPGDFSNPVIEKRQDWVNIYGDSGAPDYIPIDLNEGIDLRRLQIETELTDGQEYAWRVSYRDHNQKWSEWSSEQTFTVNESLTAYTDFSANLTIGEAPLSISFTDLSYPAASSWSWDFDDDGSEDSNIQDPEFVYNFPGFYTVKLITNNGTEIKDMYINVEDNTVEIIENKNNDIVRINPNPCTEKTDIEFYLTENGVTKITILDSNGKLVKVLNGSELSKGKHTIEWLMNTDSSAKVVSGNYFVKVESKKLNEVKKIVVIRK
jgi:PKD repeat protein